MGSASLHPSYAIAVEPLAFVAEYGDTMLPTIGMDEGIVFELAGNTRNVN